MLNAPQFDDSSFKSTKEKFTYLINRDEDIDDNDIDSFKVSFGTMSDSFIIRAYRNSNEFVILWKLWKKDNDIGFSDLKDYGNEIHEHRILFTEFSSYVLLLDKILSIPDILPDISN
jgi:hypothetical protein